MSVLYLLKNTLSRAMSDNAECDRIKIVFITHSVAFRYIIR